MSAPAPVTSVRRQQLLNKITLNKARLRQVAAGVLSFWSRKSKALFSTLRGGELLHRLELDYISITGIAVNSAAREDNVVTALQAPVPFSLLKRLVE